MQTNTDDFGRIATHVSVISIIGNTVLSLFKAFAGLIAHSGAMVSDAVHSASDVISSLIVIIGVKLSCKESDKEHPYGHERFECVAAIILAVILLMTGLMIGIEALKNMVQGKYQTLSIPGIIASLAAIVSIISKEVMYWYTRFYALQYESSALMADAWHHRSDALSSIGALIGILGARMGYPVLDEVASFVICLFILKAAIDIFKDAINKMIDHACDESTQKALRQCASNQDGVLCIDVLQTRQFANKIYVDIEIGADESLTLNESHSIAERVHNAIEAQFPRVKHIMVHVNPMSKKSFLSHNNTNAK